MAKFTLEIEGADAEAMAMHLERIAGMIRDGFTSGDASPEGGRGWWDVCDLADEPELEDEPA